MRRNVVIVSGAAIVLAGALLWASQGADDDNKAIDQFNERFNATFSAHDASKLATFYAEDAQSVFSNGARMKGRSAIEKANVEFFAKNPQAKVAATTSVISRRFLKPDLVVEDGHWDVDGLSENLPDKTVYTAVLVKRDGAWQIAYDVTYTPVDEQSLVGTWELVSAQYGNDPPQQGRRALKMITDTHFTAFHHDDKGSLVMLTGGPYTRQGDRYVEQITFASENLASFTGKEVSFTVKVEGDMFTQSGQLPNGVKLEEVWRRVR